MSDTGSFIRIPKPANLTPLLLSLMGALCIGAFSFAWQTSKDVALLRAQQNVNPVEFARLQAEVQAQAKDIERVRSWLKSHRHAGEARASHEPPAPSEP